MLLNFAHKSQVKFLNNFGDKSSPQKLYPRNLNFFANFGKDIFVELRSPAVQFLRGAFVTEFCKQSQVNLVRIFSVILQ